MQSGSPGSLADLDCSDHSSDGFRPGQDRPSSLTYRLVYRERESAGRIIVPKRKLTGPNLLAPNCSVSDLKSSSLAG